MSFFARANSFAVSLAVSLALSTAGARDASAAPPPKRPTVLVAGSAAKVVGKRVEQEGFTVVAGAANLATDSDAIGAASKAGAAVAVLTTSTVTADGPLRGARLHGARARVGVRVLDVANKKVLFEDSAADAGYGATPAVANGAARAAAAGRAMIAVAARMTARWPVVAPTVAGAVDVVVLGATGWASVLGLVSHLSATAGIDRAAVARLGRGRIVVRVETKLSPGKVAAAARSAQLGVPVDARVRGGAVRVSLQAKDVSS